jgi:1,4-dihydroxy-6-naphthoate synthase
MHFSSFHLSCHLQLHCSVETIMNTLSLGYSPCPNDTYIFYALAHGRCNSAGLQFAEPLLEDVETLNHWAMAHRLDVTKISFHALGHVLDEYCLLHAGSALGRGCGPLLVTTAGKKLTNLAGARIAIPGRYTTAALLFRMYAPLCSSLVEMRFDMIMAAIRDGSVDGGVIIHEGRFTYGQMGLVCLQDLGQWWEQTTGHPIPLGCIAARRCLGQDCIRRIDSAIRNSLEFARAYPDQCLAYIRSHSQELEGVVVKSHIDLYVNDFSLDIGVEGLTAAAEFLRRGRAVEILPHGDWPLTIDGNL